MKKLLIALLGLIVVLVVAVVVAPRVIDWNSFKPEIAQAVRDATGRDLSIDGDIELSVLPDLSFAVAGVRLSNAAGGASPALCRVAVRQSALIRDSSPAAIASGPSINRPMIIRNRLSQLMARYTSTVDRAQQ